MVQSRCAVLEFNGTTDAMNAEELNSLTGTRWVHSHEEDRPGETVYRRTGYPFPPSRGRSSFELNPDGTLAGTKPGPTDRTTVHSGSWTLDDNVLKLSVADQQPQVFQVKSLEPDKLVVERQG